MSQLSRAWLMAFRPKTLTAAIVPVVVGTALASALRYPIKWHVIFCALFGAICIQIGTNLVNDAVDAEKGADDENRLGPKRVTASGLIPQKMVMHAGLTSFVLALFFGIPLVIEGGWAIVLIGVVSLVCGYAYTAGPFPLAYRGLGDLFVLIFFGLIAVGGVYYLHTGYYEIPALVAGLQVGLLATSLIAINNLRDVVGDKKVDKKTLAVRFGRRFVIHEIIVLSVLPFILNLVWLEVGYWMAGLLPMILTPLAARVIYGVYNTEPGPNFNLFLEQAAALHLMFGILLSIGLILS